MPEILTLRIKNKPDGGYTEGIDLIINGEIADTYILYLMPYAFCQLLFVDIQYIQ